MREEGKKVSNDITGGKGLKFFRFLLSDRNLLVNLAVDDYIFFSRSFYLIVGEKTLTANDGQAAGELVLQQLPEFPAIIV